MDNLSSQKTDGSTHDSSYASLKDTSLLQTLCCPNFWLLWCDKRMLSCVSVLYRLDHSHHRFSMFFCTGSGLMVINHLAQVGNFHEDRYTVRHCLWVWSIISQGFRVSLE